MLLADGAESLPRCRHIHVPIGSEHPTTTPDGGRDMNQRFLKTGAGLTVAAMLGPLRLR